MPHTQSPQPDHAQADFRLTYHGTITTITPLSDACREWVEENVEIEAWQRFGNAIAVEPRYVEQLAEAMIEEGFALEGDLSEVPRRKRGWAVIAAALVIALAGCGPSRSVAYQHQLEADHQACLNGSTPNACIAYKLDVQKCSVISGNPYAAGCY